MAKALQLPFVCVFEDDAVGCVNVKEKLQRALTGIPDDADIFILGNNKTFGIKKDLGDGLVMPTKTYGLHSYIVMQKNYSEFIKYFSTTDGSCGLTGAGKNVYLNKYILFCQYSKFPGKNLTYFKTGFRHDSLPKEYIAQNFAIR